MAARDTIASAGARLVIVADQEIGAQQFVDAVVEAQEGGATGAAADGGGGGGGDGSTATAPPFELYFDDSALFKQAMGGRKVSNWWLLKPSVVMRIVSLARRFGNEQSDVNDKAALMGGELVIGQGAGGVLYEYHEDSKFGHAPLEELIAAARAAAGGQAGAGTGAQCS